jgi:CBS domain-containing protein
MVACTTLTAEVQERGYERREHFERERNRNHDRCTRSHRKEGGRHGLVTVAPDDDLNRVMKLMTRHRVRHMPVLRDGKLSGIISIGDVVNHRLDDLELEANILRDAYISEASRPTQAKAV